MGCCPLGPHGDSAPGLFEGLGRPKDLDLTLRMIFFFFFFFFFFFADMANHNPVIGISPEVSCWSFTPWQRGWEIAQFVKARG